MTTRRDFLIGGACAAGAGAAYVLKPKRRVSLLGRASLADVTPNGFGDWTSRDVSDLVAPATEGSLMAKLYAQTVERVYQQTSTGAQVMLLLAYGDSQTNELQLHRPEVCYPAFGFEISGNESAQLPLAGAVTLPARRLVATAPGRQENIIYWTRLGQFLPVSESQQRVDRLKTSMQGVIADGVLARCSVLGADPAPAFALLEGFIAGFIRATARGARPVFIGSARANAMAAAGF